VIDKHATPHLNPLSSSKGEGRVKEFQIGACLLRELPDPGSPEPPWVKDIRRAWRLGSITTTLCRELALKRTRLAVSSEALPLTFSFSPLTEGRGEGERAAKFLGHNRVKIPQLHYAEMPE
jgi:hypothetical protein